MCADEVNYTAFTLAQFLGFVEVVRREGPRERSFLQRSGPGGAPGSDVLSTFVEGVRFVMCASEDALNFWGDSPPESRDHPGARTRRRRRSHADTGLTSFHAVESDDEGEDELEPDFIPIRSAADAEWAGTPGAAAAAAAAASAAVGSSAVATAPAPLRRRRTRRGRYRSTTASSSSDDEFSGGNADAEVLRISRGAQRAIGSFMISTPMGAERHCELRERDAAVATGDAISRSLSQVGSLLFCVSLSLTPNLILPSISDTLSYGEFCARLSSDAAFAARMAPIRSDIAALASGEPWDGEGPFPAARWTRVLLLQQLLVEAMELLDPDTLRVPADRRTPLSGLRFVPLLPVAEAAGDYQHRLQGLAAALDGTGAALRLAACGGGDLGLNLPQPPPM